jgi:hypothetical protein
LECAFLSGAKAKGTYAIGEPMEQLLFDRMRITRKEYRYLSHAYDRLLREATRHGTREMILFLAEASRIAPALAEALIDYQATVQEVSEFYIDKGWNVPSDN